VSSLGFTPDTVASFFFVRRSEVLDDENSAVAVKCYELCNAAANHITSIGKSWNSLPAKNLAEMAVWISFSLSRKLHAHPLFCIPMLLYLYSKYHAFHQS
jgi:hypothetical protein